MPKHRHNLSKLVTYSSEINQDKPIASSQVFELLLSFINRIK